jgi:MFS family permease
MPNSPSLTKKIWISIILLSFAGQLAWGVENQFFNTFMYNNITPDPRPIAWMVAASAVTATLTTILMGTLSDRTRSRWGRRKPFILFGYLAWGVLTALYPSASFFQPIGLAVFMAILLDCVMTFFGSTANDAALNAYITDVSTIENRGRVMGVVEILTWLAILIVYGGAGPIIDSLGYYAFFYLIGGLVLLLGLVGSAFIHEEPLTDKPVGTYWHHLRESFQWKNLVANRNFFLLMIAVMLWQIAFNIFFPYIIIYLQHYLQLDITSSSIAIAAIILFGGIAIAWSLGLLVDRWGRKPVALAAIVAEMVGLILFSLTKSLIPLIITGILWLAPYTAWTIATGTWSKDLFPEDKRGQFAGFYLLFWVMLPMILGPLTGGWLSSTYGIKTVIDGQAAIVPTPLLFQVAGVGTLLAAIPLWFVQEQKKQASINKTTL